MAMLFAGGGRLTTLCFCWFAGNNLISSKRGRQCSDRYGLLALSAWQQQQQQGPEAVGGRLLTSCEAV